MGQWRVDWRKAMAGAEEDNTEGKVSSEPSAKVTEDNAK